MTLPKGLVDKTKASRQEAWPGQEGLAWVGGVERETEKERKRLTSGDARGGII